MPDRERPAGRHRLRSDALLLQNRLPESWRELRLAADANDLPRSERSRLQAEAAYRRILSGDLYDGAREAARVVRASDASGDRVAATIARIAWAHALYYRGELQKAVLVLRPAHLAATQLEDSDLRCRVDIDLAVLDLHADRMTEAQLLLSADEDIVLRAPDAWQLPRYYYAAAYSHFYMGEWARATVEFRTGLNIANGLNMVWWANAARSWLANILIHQDELDAAEHLLSLAENDIQTATPNGAADYVIASRARLAEARGDTGRAVELTREAVRLIRRWGTSIHYRQVGPEMVRLLVREHHRAEAATIVAALMDLAARSGVASVEAAALYARGILESNADLLIRAVSEYRAAGRPVDLAHACEEAAVLLAREGSRASALPFFEDAIAQYERVGARRDLHRIRARMRSLGFHIGPRQKHVERGRGLDSLTLAEGEVVRLLLMGLTNRQIASRLYLSPRTVEAHLEHISAKLGVFGRVAIAVAVSRARVGHDEATTPATEDSSATARRG